MKALLAALFTLLAAPATAEVSKISDHGFTVIQEVEVEAGASAAWRIMADQIDQWWSGAHSYSGDAANLYMEVERNGCFCEKLPNGGHAEHLRIIYHSPGDELRFEGALGPLQSMPVSGRMIWKIEPGDSASLIRFTYHVTGHPEAGLADISAAVDAVIGEQLSRLAGRLDQD